MCLSEYPNRYKSTTTEGILVIFQILENLVLIYPRRNIVKNLPDAEDQPTLEITLWQSNIALPTRSKYAKHLVNDFI